VAGARQAAAERAVAERAAAEQAVPRREAARQAAAQAQAQAEASLHDPHGTQPVAADVDLEAVAGLLDDEDDDEDDDAGYGQIMLSMTRNSRRQRPDQPG
jgi:hypothetical protein